MINSTFASSPTVTPFVKASSLVLYIILIWCIVSLMIFSIGLLVGFLTKFRFYKKKTVFYVSVMVGFLIELILLAAILSRMIFPALLFGVIVFLILWLTRKGRKMFWIGATSFVLVCAILGFLLPVSLPVGSEMITKSPNSAYSLKTTSEDMALFANELLQFYEREEGVQKEVFDPQIQIDETNSWGLGLAIEVTSGNTTYWHSGINPGMQSLFVIDPASNSVVAIMTNSDDGLSFAQRTAREVLNIDGVWEIIRVNLKELS